MEKVVFEFFEKHIDVTRPILLGYSGGPDSSCLLQLLVRWKRVDLHLVHLDHGWRKESAGEAEEIKKLAAHLHVPLHWTRLDVPSSGNLEALCREARLAFFHKVCSNVGAQGCLLGHHADDQQETVFKRILEGTSLVHLAGMAPRFAIDSTLFLRPLLAFRKSQILAWLEKNGIAYFDDYTNSDRRFLRARMRTEIFPFLRQSFGKEFDTSLSSIAQEASELKGYLDERIAPYLERAVTGAWGTFIENCPTSPVECKQLIQTIARRQNALFSRTQLQTACELIASKSANKQVSSLKIDRGNAFFYQNEPPDVEGKIDLQVGQMHLGNWQISCRYSDEPTALANSYKDAWKSTLRTYLQAGTYSIGQVNFSHFRRNKKVLKQFLTEKKVPHFLWTKVPMIFQGDTVVEDFLTATKPASQPPNLLICELRQIGDC